MPKIKHIFKSVISIGIAVKWSGGIIRPWAVYFVNFTRGAMQSGLVFRLIDVPRSGLLSLAPLILIILFFRRLSMNKKGFTLIEVIVIIAIVAMIGGIVFSCVGCEDITNPQPKSATGVKKAHADVQTQASGLTVEQEGVKRRIELENMPGAVKHLYVISAYSGQVIIYSTVKGKVTSSGKRLTPYAVACMDGQYVGGAHQGFPINIGGHTKRTGEVLQDDGTYGHSIPYLFWWDASGKYHQHYVSGGQILHVSDQPLAVKSIIINMEMSAAE